MSLYNLMFGSVSDNEVKLIVKWFGWDPRNFPRFRDANIDSSTPRVIVLTRTGGGNREEYEEENDELEELNGYVKNKDASFDTTYAKWYYNIPEDYKIEWEEYIELFKKVNQKVGEV